MGKRVRIHINRGLAHQVQHGELLKQSFVKHGYHTELVFVPTGGADIHVISGPHFAYEQWKDNCIMIDRCYYRGDPDHICMTWVKDGQKVFSKGEGRKPPDVKPRKTGNKTLFLADYNGPIEQADTIRYHPAKQQPTETLEQAIARHDVAIGYQTTALVMAALEGIRIACKDPNHILNQPDWLGLLPYADWGINEFDEAISHLLCHSP